MKARLPPGTPRRFPLITSLRGGSHFSHFSFWKERRENFSGNKNAKSDEKIALRKEGVKEGHIMKVRKGTAQIVVSSRAHLHPSSFLFLCLPPILTEPAKTSWQGKDVNTEEKSGQWLGATVISTSRPPHFGKLLVSRFWLEQKSRAAKVVCKITSYDFYALFYFKRIKR